MYEIATNTPLPKATDCHSALTGKARCAQVIPSVDVAAIAELYEIATKVPLPYAESNQFALTGKVVGFHAPSRTSTFIDVLSEAEELQLISIDAAARTSVVALAELAAILLTFADSVAPKEVKEPAVLVVLPALDAINT